MELAIDILITCALVIIVIALTIYSWRKERELDEDDGWGDR